jgi:3-hydroxyisobutyrate dehydrogenase-like beta-hydroxyacid dehydrogenase
MEVRPAILPGRLKRWCSFDRIVARFSNPTVALVLRTFMEIAWIGTGIMGAPMARRLLKGGHQVRVYNRSAEKARALASDGATVAADAAEAARGASVVFVMVSDTPDVEGVVAKIEPVLARGQLVIDMSTIAPEAERKIATRLSELGADYLDAPVSGGETGAIEGTLAIMVGGDEAAFDRVRPLFDLMGKRVTHMGPAGAGQTTKLANQIAVAVTLEAAAEALLFARQGGLDPAKVIEAIGAGAAGSWQLNNLGPRIVAGDYRPGFFVQLMRKDLRLVSEAAQGNRLALPGLALMTSMFNAASALGHDRDGTQAVAAALDRMAVLK